jgi:hypothetical protein
MVNPSRTQLGHCRRLGKFRIYDLSGHHHPHPGLLLHYCGCSAAKREERRYFRGFWRARQPNGVRSSRGGQCAVQGHDVVGRGVHDHFHHAVGLRIEAKRSNLGTPGCEVPTSEDATRADTEALHSAYPEVGSQHHRPALCISQRNCWLLFAFLTVKRVREHLVRGAPNGKALRSAPVQSRTIYRLPCNCICLTEDVPSN